MYKELAQYLSQLEEENKSIPSKRKELLEEVAEYISKKLAEGDEVKLNFICTHNSRRSHLAQIWATVAAAYFNIEPIRNYSGGTEATAFHPNAVSALERAGLQTRNPGGHNPEYEVHFSDAHLPITAFSKTYDYPSNPNSGFAAIMTCSDADENCPFIPGAEFRASVNYIDPKISDGTPEEEATYDERCRQIATEIFYMMSKVKGLKN
jgi:arsenate reductase